MQSQSAKRQSDILDALQAHVCLLDQAGNILQVNNQWKQFALENGFKQANYGVGSNYVEICDNASGAFSEEARNVADLCRAVLAGSTASFELEYACHSPTEQKWFNLTVSRLNKRKSAGAVVIHTNITKRKQIENRLLHDASHDPLTGLANRHLFTDHLQMTIERAKRDPAQLFAVLFLDFDRFKSINDSFGHLEGDSLLKQIARRLETAIRSSDLAARLGGDEFTVLLNNINDIAIIPKSAERIQDQLQMPFEIGGSEIFVTASIGIVLNRADHEKAEDLLRDADLAMYRAKAQGKAQYQIFKPERH